MGPVHLLNYSVIQSANHVAAAHCIKSCRYLSSLHSVYIKHQNGRGLGSCACGMLVDAETAMISYDFHTQQYLECCEIQYNLH